MLVGPTLGASALIPTATSRPPTVRLSSACSNVDLRPTASKATSSLRPPVTPAIFSREPVVAGVERVVGAECERALEHLGLDVDGDHRHGADQPCELHDVGADAADAPHADRFADADLAGAHHGAERRRHRVGQDRRLLQRDVVGNTGEADGLRDGVLRPRAVVGERHQLDGQAVRRRHRGGSSHSRCTAGPPRRPPGRPRPSR